VQGQTPAIRAAQARALSGGHPGPVTPGP